MTAAEILLTDLRSVGVTVILAAGGELRCRSRRGVLTPELRRRVAELKFDLIFILEDEAYEINWRAEAMKALAGDDGATPKMIAAAPSEGACCECCAEPQDRERVPRCVLCCLAAAQLVEERRSGGDIAQDRHDQPGEAA